MENRVHILMVNGLPVDEAGNLIPIAYLHPECLQVETPHFWIGWCPFCGSRIEHAGRPDQEGWLGLYRAKCENDECPCRKFGYYLRVCPQTWEKIKGRF